ncbi:MAG TPA: uroporphyrinogen decarboxylase family protein, partial [Gemmataceae bacterium]|nr:uroporphyrinogen decarboxylase family protein [Gemmataceae bacterium]
AVAMGLRFALEPGRGPVPDRPVRTQADVQALDASPDPERFRHVIDMLHTVQRELQGELPVIVFAGAPFTLASYCIGTGKDLSATRRFAEAEPRVWDELLHRLERATVQFLQVLIAEGADLYQLFDSWAGMLERSKYQRWAQPFHQAIFAGAKGVPRILFVKECPYLEWMTKSGAEVISLGTCHDLAAARRDYPDLVFQGNVDEEILRAGSVEQVIEATRRCLVAGGGQRHIVNLNHGVERSTPVANFAAFVQTVKEGG